MKIALIGYGRMGHEIEKIAAERGHSVIFHISSQSTKKTEDVHNVDVAIEFTRPDAAFNNITSLINKGIPVVSGTTGWNDKLAGIEALVKKQKGAFLHSSNFSIGVNIFFEINKKLALLMNQFPDYDVSVEETHHVKKLDAPSGTAVTLVTQILEALERKQTWKLMKDETPGTDNILAVKSYREGDVPGTHNVKYISSIDEIEIIHKAHNRIGFARGAVLAAEWLKDKKGFFTMRDFLKF